VRRGGRGKRNVEVIGDRGRHYGGDGLAERGVKIGWKGGKLDGEGMGKGRGGYGVVELRGGNGMGKV